MAVETLIDPLAIATDGYLTTLGVPGDNSIGGAPGPCPEGFEVLNLGDSDIKAQDLKPVALSEITEGENLPDVSADELEPKVTSDDLRPKMLGDDC